MLTALDEGIGNITATLKSTGMYDNSVMVLSNDNGGMSGSYGTASAQQRLPDRLLLLCDVSLRVACCAQLVGFACRHGLLQLRHLLRRAELPLPRLEGQVRTFRLPSSEGSTRLSRP